MTLRWNFIPTWCHNGIYLSFFNSSQFRAAFSSSFLLQSLFSLPPSFLSLFPRYISTTLFILFKTIKIIPSFSVPAIPDSRRGSRLPYASRSRTGTCSYWGRVFKWSPVIWTPAISRVSCFVLFRSSFSGCFVFLRVFCWFFKCFRRLLGGLNKKFRIILKDREPKLPNYVSWTWTIQETLFLYFLRRSLLVQYFWDTQKAFEEKLQMQILELKHSNTNNKVNQTFCGLLSCWKKLCVQLSSCTKLSFMSLQSVFHAVALVPGLFLLESDSSSDNKSSSLTPDFFLLLDSFRAPAVVLSSLAFD